MALPEPLWNRSVSEVCVEFACGTLCAELHRVARPCFALIFALKLSPKLSVLKSWGEDRCRPACVSCASSAHRRPDGFLRDIPTPTKDGAACNRPGLISHICDADALLAREELDNIEVRLSNLDMAHSTRSVCGCRAS